MRPEYDGVKFYSNYDLSVGYNFDKAKTILDAFIDNKDYSDINEVIELYNIFRIFASNSIKSEYAEPYSTKVKQLMPIIAHFFKSIDDQTFIEQHHAVCDTYIDDFWTLIDKFKVFENISESTLISLLREPETMLYRVLEHKDVVQHYDIALSGYMRSSDQTARILIRKFLERKDQTSESNCFIPKSLNASEYESILDRYVDSDFSDVGLLQLLASSQSSAECPISDELRLKAKRKFNKYWNDRISDGEGFSYGIGICFKDSIEPITLESVQPYQYQLTYDAKWIRENKDYPTLLNNFIYLFGFSDLRFRCAFPVVQSKLSVLERALGVKGVKEYEIGTAFRIADMKSSAEMQGYVAFLANLNIRIEDVYQWFFTEYLRNEFNADGFVFNAPTSGQSYLEKCRTLPSEIDGILKQYNLFVKNHIIDRELFEMSSNPIVFKALPSMKKNKYIYGNSPEIQKEQFLLFSDQSMLHYLPEQKKCFKSFVEALSTQNITINDYPEWAIGDIRWLRERGAIDIDTTGAILINKLRVKLLQDLYDHDVICASYYSDTEEIDKLIRSGDLRYESSLFSIPEQNYLNYMLNKSEYSNGQDLRNKYIHSTYPLDVQQQQRDYNSLLKIMAVIIIKINEEFCLKYPMS